MANRTLTTTQVAKKSEMSWITSEKYLKILLKKGYVINKKIGKSIFWRLYEKK
jgi:predicted transcriptional regulator